LYELREVLENGDRAQAEDLLRKHIRESAELVQQALPTET
jgi:DNA-binding GntR family transcriptional regulator